ACRAEASGRDGPQGHLRGGAPGCSQAGSRRGRNDSVAAPPARLVELESEGKLTDLSALALKLTASRRGELRCSRGRVVPARVFHPGRTALAGSRLPSKGEGARELRARAGPRPRGFSVRACWE